MVVTGDWRCWDGFRLPSGHVTNRRFVNTPLGARPDVRQALEHASVLSGKRVLAHLSHTCDLRVDERIFHVLDKREIVPYMNAPRGVNHIVIMSHDLAVVHSILYVTEASSELLREPTLVV